MQQIVFLTLFLGLDVRPADDRRADRSRGEVGPDRARRPTGRYHREPPWSVRVDLGKELIPRELAAVALDSHGNEIARTSQILNLPRTIAEVEIVLATEKDGQVVAQLVGRHRLHRHPRRATISVDGAKVRIDRDFRARLPRLDWSHTHVISAQMRFDDGQVARRETVINGGFADSVSSQLTPVVVAGDPNAGPQSLAGCFSIDGTPVRTSAVEKTNALVILVKDPDATDDIHQMQNVMPLIAPARDSRKLRNWLKLDRDTTLRILWPIVERYIAAGEPTYDLFNQSEDISASQAGIPWLMSRQCTPPPDPLELRRFADAVAVAGVTALHEHRRRAVVLLPGSAPDESFNKPAAVRRYLERIGVPLFVWSLDGPRPDLADTWGAVEDISTVEKVAEAVAKLDRTLLAQRVAWIAADPLSSLHVEAAGRCGVTPLATMGTQADRR